MSRRKWFSQCASLVFFLLMLLGCNTNQPASTAVRPTATQLPVTPTAWPTTVPATIDPDYWPTHGWRTAAPEEQGMDSEKLANLLGFIQENEYDMHSVTVVRNGYLILDATIYPYDQDSRHIIHSCTKSILSALIGIAIEQGFIAGVEQPVLSFFPDRTIANLDAHKEALTVEDLLMMAGGLECPDLDEMWQTDDWTQFILDHPMAEPPGTRFEYCNGLSFLLAAIIQETTGMSAAEYAEEHLFSPLGVTDVVWPANTQGITIGWGEIRMRPLDMAKIGYLYLNEGRWDDRQIIPSDWVALSTQEQMTVDLFDGFGYQWWVWDEDIYLALGSAGQYIFVAPELDLVVVLTGNLAEDEFPIPNNLLEFFILPAAKSSTPMEPNPAGVQLLESKLHEIALPAAEPEPVRVLPETANRITGMEYVLDTNPFGLLTISLTFQGGAEARMSWTANTDEAQVYLSARNS